MPNETPYVDDLYWRSVDVFKIQSKYIEGVQTVNMIYTPYDFNELHHLAAVIWHMANSN